LQIAPQSLGVESGTAPVYDVVARLKSQAQQTDVICGWALARGRLPEHDAHHTRIRGDSAARLDMVSPSASKTLQAGRGESVVRPLWLGNI
jgi:hypothetical protein